MTVRYDRETDTLVVLFRDAPVAESDEERPGLILDFDASGRLVSLELLNASEQVDNPAEVHIASQP